MARGRRNNTRKRKPPATPPKQESEQPESGRWKGLLTWFAGIASAVIIGAVGVVFTAWFNGPGSSAIDKISGGPPVEVAHVAIDYAERPTVLREPVTDPSERALMRTSGSRREAVLTRHRMALIGDMNATVVLVGNRSSARIVDIEPVIRTRGPVSDGAYLSPITAGEVGTIELHADLDRPAPRFTTSKDRRTPYFRKKQIDLKRDERVTLNLSIRGKKHYYEFDLVATVLAGDRSVEVVIHGPDGGPFRLTGPAKSYRSYYRESNLGGWELVPRDQWCAANREGC